MTQLDGKAVLVIGGSSGIGRAVASEAAALGASVCIAGRSGAQLREAVAALERSTSLEIDISDEADVISKLAGAGTFDHVVVTAGGASPLAVRGASSAKAAEGFETKFWGAYRVAAHVRFADSGSLTLVSGVFAVLPRKRQVIAGCVNAAVEALKGQLPPISFIGAVR